MTGTSPMRGTVLMLLSSVAFCAMSVLIKVIPEVDAYKTALFRFLIGMAMLGTAALFGKIELRFVNAPLLVFRGICHALGVFLFFLSISRIGLAEGTVLSNSGPVFAAMFSALFLRERIPWWHWLALTTAGLGLYLICRARTEGMADLPTLGIYEILALAGAALSGLSAVVIKRLHKTDTTHCIFFSQCIVGLWLMVIPANVVPCAIGYSGGAILLAVGVTAAFGQLLQTQAYRHTPVSVGSLLGLMLPVLNFLVGWLCFRERLAPMSILGSTLVVGACLVVAGSRRKTQPADGSRS